MCQYQYFYIMPPVNHLTPTEINQKKNKTKNPGLGLSLKSVLSNPSSIPVTAIYLKLWMKHDSLILAYFKNDKKTSEG